MPIGFIFWLLWILCLIFGLGATWPGDNRTWRGFAPFGSSIVLLIMLGLLGWRAFGFVIQG